MNERLAAFDKEEGLILEKFRRVLQDEGCSDEEADSTVDEIRNSCVLDWLVEKRLKS
jgi:hypothetical protein